MLLFIYDCFSADENRYEGTWKDDKKNGPGKFFYLDKGQVYEGTWKDGVAKCGEMFDFGRENAPDATQFPLPEVSASKCYSALCPKGCGITMCNMSTIHDLVSDYCTNGTAITYNLSAI